MTDSALPARLAALEAQKDGAYEERDRLVCALSKLWPAHLARHPDSDTTWDDDWRWIVCIHAPVGQLTWHIHDRERPWFDHLAVREGDWDGHSTAEKYARLAALLVGVEPQEGSGVAWDELHTGDDEQVDRLGSVFAALEEAIDDPDQLDVEDLQTAHAELKTFNAHYIALRRQHDALLAARVGVEPPPETKT